MTSLFKDIRTSHLAGFKGTSIWTALVETVEVVNSEKKAKSIDKLDEIQSQVKSLQQVRINVHFIMISIKFGRANKMLYS